MLDLGRAFVLGGLQPPVGLGGYDESESWSISRLLTQRADVLIDASEMLASEIQRTDSVDAIVAVRSSGAPVGIIVASQLRRPFFWFTDASEQSLFPRYKSLDGLRVALVDSHVITGGNLTRHAEILRWLKALTTGCWVLLDCDRFRDPEAEETLAARAGGVHSLWRVTQLLGALSSQTYQDTRAQVFLAQGSAKQWRGQ